QNLHEEVDFTIELKNTKEMKNIEDSKVYIPEIYSALSTSDILVIEYLDGVSINKIDDIVTGKNQKREIVNIIFQDMLLKMFDFGIFHGDPHPGNVFILPDATPALIDFGSVGK